MSPVITCVALHVAEEPHRLWMPLVSFDHLHVQIAKGGWNAGGGASAMGPPGEAGASLELLALEQ